MNKLKIFVVILYFFLTTVYITFPLIFHLKDYATETQDVLVTTWVLNWDIFAFSHMQNVFDSNIYYPYAHSLAFSDPHFTSALISLIPTLIIKEPLVAYNFSLLFSLTTLGFFTYLLVKKLSSEDLPALISGTLVAFSTYTLSKNMQLQLISIEWIPLGIIFFINFLEKKLFRYFLLAILFLYLQIADSVLAGYFLLFSYVVIFFSICKLSLITWRLYISKKTVFTLLFFVLLLFPLIIPYYQVSQDFKYVRDIRDTIHTANRPEYFFYSYGHSKLGDFFYNIFYKNNTGPYFYDGYKGFMLIILSFFVILYRVFNPKKKIHIYFNLFLLIAVASYVISLGPALQWGGKVIKSPFIIPLPYILFYYLVPGFKGIRNSGRWEMLEVFAFSVATGLLFSFILRGKKNYQKIVITFILCFLVVFEFDFPMKYYKMPIISEFPPIYKFIEKLPKNSAIIELPIYNWNINPYSNREYVREYYSTIHFKKMVNGASGFSPPEWQVRTNVMLQDFPNDATVEILKKISVNYIIMHGSEYDELFEKHFMMTGKRIKNGKSVKDILTHYQNIKLLKTIGADSIYEITL